MKKKVILFFLIVMCGFFISCGSKTGDEGNTGDSDDTENTGEVDDIGDPDIIDDTHMNDNESDLTNDLDDTENLTDDSDTGNTGDDTDTGNTGNTGDIDNTENQVPDDIGTMVDVPTGKFQMGCNEAVDDQCFFDEYPYHEVTLSAYKIDKYEVTVGEYQKCIDAGYCNNDNHDEPHYSAYGEQYCSNCNLGITEKSNHPVNCVSWYGADAYCKWVGKRLPTEAEWEKAARGTNGARYSWGNEPEVNCEYAVMAPYNEETYENEYGCNKGSTWIIGNKKKGKSPYGAYDMIGNVMEWTNDYYDQWYYNDSPSKDPTGPESGANHTLRGGSWLYDKNGDIEVLNDSFLRASSRRPLYPEDTKSPDNGFRCAVSE